MPGDFGTDVVLARTSCAIDDVPLRLNAWKRNDLQPFRNLLMEPNINGDLTHSVVPPQDLTFTLLQDIGW